MTLSNVKKVWFAVLVGVVALAMGAVFSTPTVASAQVPNPTDINEDTEGYICDAFQHPVLPQSECEDEEEDNGGNDDTDGDDSTDEEEDNGEVTPPTNNSGSNGGGGGGGRSKKAGEVLGASSEVCSTPLITTYLGLDKANDLADTVKLQVFLASHLGLELAPTGTFDQATEEAVKQFQLKYASEVLAPWLPFGLASETTATGYVYKTTQRMINKIYCASLEIPMPQLP